MPASKNITLATLMCHPPVIVPGVGRGRERSAAATAEAMREAARRIVASAPDTIVLISPHSPRRQSAFGVWDTRRITGSFERFQAPEEIVDLPNDTPFVDTLTKSHDFWPIGHDDDTGLDHGATVPLYFIAEIGWTGPTVVVSLNLPNDGHLNKLGAAIAATAESLGRRIAIVASGDMSHRLSQGAPSGYHPEAYVFDRMFISRLEKQDPDALLDIDPDLAELAAEDVLDPVFAALHSTGFDPSGVEVINYDAPFGVGYGIAVLYSPPLPLTSLPIIARLAISAALSGQKYHPQKIGSHAATFVTLRSPDGKLRGCIGSIEPRENDVGTETARNAIAAALDDPRFPAISAAELKTSEIEVSVLSPPQPITSPDELDPSVYGVVIEASDGRRGVMLPAVPNLETVDQQLAATREKAEIGRAEPVTLQRFTVDKLIGPI